MPKFKKDKSNQSYSKEGFMKNIHFLQHLIDCIQKKKDQEVIDKTIVQLKSMIDDQKNKVKGKKTSRRIS